MTEPCQVLTNQKPVLTNLNPALSATPLNIVLTGRSSFFHQSRNLKLAFLLMQKGANPNLRIPNHDLESASESPLEMLLRYYQVLTNQQPAIFTLTNHNPETD